MEGDRELLAEPVRIAEAGIGELGTDRVIGGDMGGRVEASVASTKTVLVGDAFGVPMLKVVESVFESSFDELKLAFGGVSVAR